MEVFGVEYTVAALGVALYVIACKNPRIELRNDIAKSSPDGIGPLLWSPLSEVPVLGRNILYMVTFSIFVILCVPTALADNIGGLLVLRFLQGFFGSPCLANGGASMGDMVCYRALQGVRSAADAL